MLMTLVWHCIIQTRITKFNFWLPAESFSWKTNGFSTYRIENRTPCSLFLVNSVQEFRGHEKDCSENGLRCRISDGVSIIRASFLSDVHKTFIYLFIYLFIYFLASWQFSNCPRTSLISWNPEFSRAVSQTTFCVPRSYLLMVHLALPTPPSLNCCIPLIYSHLSNSKFVVQGK